MPRKTYYAINQHPFHVTARTDNREWFDLPMIQIWDMFSQHLYFLTLIYGIRIHAFVLMSNHFHLLITTPESNLEQVMESLVQKVSESIRLESNNTLQIFSGPCHWTAIKNRRYYKHAYKYVYRNPVEARICKNVESYPYSTLRGLLGRDRLSFPAFDNLELIVNPHRQLSWLNTPYPDVSYLDFIREALMQPEFDLSSAQLDSVGSQCTKTFHFEA